MTPIATLDLGGRHCAITRPSDASACLAALGDRPISAIVADATTAEFLPEPAGAPPTCVLPPGEAGKQPAHYIGLLEWLASRGLTRETVILGFGGGALTDTAAFAASTYLRGISFVLVPTTLLAMVDAAIGGKTGIDLAGFKNVVGTFAVADEVRIQPAFLSTLPEREYRSGLAEVIKAALLGDLELLALLEEQSDAVVARKPIVVAEMIERAVRVKVSVVQRDFDEQGVRASLNLGHTFAHALETCLGLGEWSHGEAVAWGIVRAMRLGRRLGLTDDAWAGRVERVIGRYGYEVDATPARADDLLAAMQMDKKRRRDGLRFVLQRSALDTVVRPVGRADIEAIL